MRTWWWLASEPHSDAAEAVLRMAVEMQRLVAAYGTSRQRAAAGPIKP
jgi:hypothetical protein